MDSKQHQQQQQQWQKVTWFEVYHYTFHGVHFNWLIRAAFKCLKSQLKEQPSVETNLPLLVNQSSSSSSRNLLACKLNSFVQSETEETVKQGKTVDRDKWNWKEKGRTETAVKVTVVPALNSSYHPNVNSLSSLGLSLFFDREKIQKETTPNQEGVGRQWEKRSILFPYWIWTTATTITETKWMNEWMRIRIPPPQIANKEFIYLCTAVAAAASPDRRKKKKSRGKCEWMKKLEWKRRRRLHFTKKRLWKKWTSEWARVEASLQG